jgi:hypothetical protein
MNVAGTAGVLQGPNLVQNVTWWGDGVSTAGAGNLPRVFVTTSQSTTANTPRNIVDNTRGTFWVNNVFPSTSVPETFGLEFPTAVTISAVVIRGRQNGSYAYNPSDYTIETSDNGQPGTWTVQATLTRNEVWPIAASNGGGWTEPLKSRVSANPVVAVLPTPVTTKWIRLVATRAYCKEELSTQTCTNMQVEELEIR